MGSFLTLLEDLDKQLHSKAAKTAQAIGNAKNSIQKAFSKKKRKNAASYYTSKWDGLQEYFRFNKDGYDEYWVNVMNVFKNLSFASGDPDPAHYFNDLLSLVRKSDEEQENKLSAEFWTYYGKRYHPEYNDPIYPNNPYNKPETELVNNFLSVVAEAKEAVQLKEDQVSGLLADSNQNSMLFQQMLSQIHPHMADPNEDAVPQAQGNRNNGPQ
jgi:hypothetical protein